MEPRPCGRGNARLREPGREPGGGFNGATTLRSWKHSARDYRSGLGAASMEPRPCGRGNYRAYPAGGVRAVRFNGATTLRSWKLPAGPRAGRRPKGFNGATTLRSWKHPRVHASLVGGAAASMEPRPCGRGNLKVMLRTAAVHSFNGATTLRSWKRWRARKSCWTQLRLQWSHDLAVVETACTGPRTIWRWSGFNGATTLRSWKLDAAVAQRRVLVCFNGATTLRSWKQHRAEALVLIVLLASMEPRPCGRGNHEYKRGALHSGRLQWSHDLAVVETCAARWPPIGEAGSGFNGATTLRSWKPSMEPTKRSGTLGFNGATTLRSWKRAMVITARYGGRWLQWSHDLAVVETAHGPSWAPLAEELQWSHDLAVVETRWRAGAAAERPDRFNGATTLRSWKPVPARDRARD